MKVIVLSIASLFLFCITSVTPRVTVHAQYLPQWSTVTTCKVYAGGDLVGDLLFGEKRDFVVDEGEQLSAEWAYSYNGTGVTRVSKAIASNNLSWWIH